MQFFPRPITLTLASATVLLALGCASSIPISPSPADPIKREAYRIGVTDLLVIQVWNNKDIDLRVPVRSDGMISVPLIDDVPAEGLTPEELKEVITEELSEFISAPDVTVVVIQTNSQQASILGGVGRSRTFSLDKDMRVLDAIATAGGFTTWAKKNQVRILRKTPNGIAEYRFNITEYRFNVSHQVSLTPGYRPPVGLGGTPGTRLMRLPRLARAIAAPLTPWGRNVSMALAWRVVIRPPNGWRRLPWWMASRYACCS